MITSREKGLGSWTEFLEKKVFNTSKTSLSKRIYLEDVFYPFAAEDSDSALFLFSYFFFNFYFKYGEIQNHISFSYKYIIIRLSREITLYSPHQKSCCILVTFKFLEFVLVILMHLTTENRVVRSYQWYCQQ